MPHFAVYLAPIRSTEPATLPSSEANLPQSETHSLPKAIFKQTLVRIGSEQKNIGGFAPEFREGMVGYEGEI